MVNKRVMNAEDLFTIQSVSDPRISPNGDEAVFVKTHIDEDLNDYISNLYHLNLKNDEITQWTFGEKRISQPRWSHDSKQLLFISNRDDKNQLYLLATNGGEAKKITDEENGVIQASFSPDGTKIVYQTSVSPDENKEEDSKDKNGKELLKPTIVDRMKYKADGAGLIDIKYHQIKVYDIETEDVKTIKEGNQNYYFQTWIDNDQIVYSTDEDVDQDFNFNHNIYIYNLNTSEATEIPTSEGYVTSFSVSPNRDNLLFVHMGREYANATHAKVYLHQLKTNKTTCLTDDLDFPVGDYVAADIQQQTVLQHVVWANDDEFYFPVSKNGNVVLYYGHVNGDIKPVLEDDFHIYGFDVHENTVILTISTSTNPSEVYKFDLKEKQLKQISHVNKKLLEEVEIVKPEAISYKSKDDWTVHGWFMKPAQYKEGETYPMVVNIHGGPHAFYANTFFHEMQLIAARGYAVLYVNPRGSHSYGQEFVDAVRGEYGNGDYQDIMNGVDYVLNEYSWIDEQRLGVTGGSYGGFMTNWIVGHTDRFKAAVTQRSISNWISFRGVSDIGYYFNEWQIKADLNDLDKLWKHSPLAYVDNIKTPLLIVHSENDYRCPIEQAEQLFIALKHQKKETKFIRFPQSDHNLSRTGKPNLRIERLNHIIGWFDDYINK